MIKRLSELMSFALVGNKYPQNPLKFSIHIKNLLSVTAWILQTITSFLL